MRVGDKMSNTFYSNLCFFLPSPLHTYVPHLSLYHIDDPIFLPMRRILMSKFGLRTDLFASLLREMSELGGASQLACQTTLNCSDYQLTHVFRHHVLRMILVLVRRGFALHLDVGEFAHVLVLSCIVGGGNHVNMPFPKSQTNVRKMIHGLDLSFVVHSVVCFERKQRTWVQCACIRMKSVMS